MDVPLLTDSVVTLRAHADGDTDALVAQCSDPQVQRWTTVPVPFTSADATDWIASRARDWQAGTGELTWVVDTGDGLVGQLGLRPDGAGAAEVGFGLAAAHRGQGVMSAAVRLAVAWAFEELGVDVVHWRAQVGNWGSRRVAWACGFTVEGCVRGLLEHRGQRRDAWVGSLRAGEPLRPGTPWLDVPRLLGPTVVLRRHTDADAPRIAQACDDPSTQAWLPDLPTPYTERDAHEYVHSREEQHAAGSGVFWALADPGTDELLGAIGVMGTTAASRSREIGYWAHPDARGRGLMTAAVRLTGRHALLPVTDGGLGMTRVFARAADGNDASVRVLLGAGFTEVGRDRRGERLRDGSVVDFRRFDLLATEL